MPTTTDTKFLDKTGLVYFWGRLKTYFVHQEDGKGLSTNDLTNDLKSNYDDAVTKANALTTAGAEANKINTIKINGVESKPDSSKAVDIPIPTKVSALDNDMDYQTESQVSSSIVMELGRFANQADKYFVHQEDGKGLSTNDLTNDLKTAYDNAVTAVNELVNAGAQANVIEKVAVNGTDLTPDTEKRINVTVPTLVSALTNDSGYQTSTQVQTAITNALASIAGIKFEVVTELPSSGVNGTIYLIAHSHSDARDTYDEYAWIGDKYEKIGNTDVDLSGYIRKDEIDSITTSEIDSMFNQRSTVDY